MTIGLVRKGTLLFLATVFTVGLTFATVELPYYVDEVLQRTVHTPGGDSHVDEVARLKTELFMAHYHVRAVGYSGFFLLMGLIGAGFATRRTGLATLGALGVMLPVFAQFAAVMFFLAGLGVLNALWLPILDLSLELHDWGLIIRAPNDLLRWLLGLAGVDSIWPTILFFIGSGILVFLLGTYAWLTARARGNGVADLWVYRISRHPQYLGWILWTYGAFLLIQRLQYPRRSWGIGASLPWLISTMVIIAVAMMEELNMRKRHGEAYDAYRKTAPFLFPVPGFIERLFALPLRLLFKKSQPDRRREVVGVVGFFTVLLIGLSAFFYGGGIQGAVAGFTSPEARAARIQDLADQLEEEENRRRRNHLAAELASFGEPAVGTLIALLEGGNPESKVLAAEALGSIGSEAAVPALTAALGDPSENLRYWSAQSLSRIRSPAAIDALFPLLDDPESHVRMTALGALAKLKHRPILGKVTEFLRDDSHWIRGQAVDALGELGEEEVIPLLVERLDDEHEWVRREAVIALLRIGSPLARPALQKALSDEDFEVRIYAAEALERLPGE
jgi:protein-S-isoprenylcysteine O-methyltransferase Ste14